MKRRGFIKGLIGLAGVTTLTGLYAWQIEPFWLEFVKLKMPIKNLPDEMVGKTVMQLSDLHIGSRFDWQYIIDAFEKAKEFEPDIVVYTGDYITRGDTVKGTQDLQTVFDSAVKGKMATVGILGNHDYGEKWQELEVAKMVVSILESKGLTILRNQFLEIVPGFSIWGIDDFWSGQLDFKQFKDVYKEEEAYIALVHNPDVCDQNAWGNYQGWILSGHTHGGQVKPPFLPAPILPISNKKYASGYVDLEDGRHLYVNRALGHLWQVRFNVRPEITIFTLEKA